MRFLAAIISPLSILFTVQFSFAAGKYDEISAQALARLQSKDILVFGEDHQNSISRELLMDILNKGFASGQIDGFTTEYVLAEVEEEFQKYLASPTAGPESEEETQLFSKITNEYRFVWFKDETNKKFFRFLRQQKLKYGKKIAICGNDALPSQWRPNGDPSTNPEENNRQLRIKRFSEMPHVLLSAAIEKFKMNKDEMINSLYTNYDREAMMALRSAQCLSKSKRAIIHMGALHAWSLNFMPPSQDGAPIWEATSHFLPVLLPGRSIETMNFMTTDPANPGSIAEMKKIISDLGRSEDAMIMVSRNQLNSYIRSRAPEYPENGPLSMWDQVILSSENKKVLLWGNAP